MTVLCLCPRLMTADVHVPYLGLQHCAQFPGRWDCAPEPVPASVLVVVLLVVVLVVAVPL